MERKKASLFAKWLILLKIIYATGRISIYTLLNVWLKRLTREKCDKWLNWWSAKCLKYINLSFEVNLNGFEFKENIPYIIMSNHASHFDIPLIFQSLKGKSIRMLTKKELFKIFIWGRAMREAEFISIDRTNAKQSLRDLDSAIEKMKSGIALWVAPEGTRSQDKKLLPFKKGGFKIALDMSATIIPVGIQGSGEALAAKSSDFYKNQHVIINVGAPVEAVSYKDKPMQDLVLDVEEKIRILAAYS